MSSFFLVPDLHSSDGIPVPRFDVVDDNGKRSTLYTTIHVKGKVGVALRFRCFV